MLLAGVAGEDPGDDPAPGDDPGDDPQPNDIELVIDNLVTTTYGNNWGENAVGGELRTTFESTGAGLEFSVVGYDIDHKREVEVWLNGALLGMLGRGQTTRSMREYSFAIEATANVRELTTSSSGIAQGTQLLSGVSPTC